MKVQIKNFSTHQTAKVFVLLMATASLVFMIPFSLVSLFSPAAVGPDGQEVSVMPFTLLMIFIMPIMQAVMGYLMMRVGLWAYNTLNPRIGGFEFEFEEADKY